MEKYISEARLKSQVLQNKKSLNWIMRYTVMKQYYFILVT
jgi:hypothetical protein